MTGPRATLTPEIERLIQETIGFTDIPACRRDQIRQDLVDHFEEGLIAGRSSEELVESFGDALEAGRRIEMVCADETMPSGAGADSLGGFSAVRRGEGLYGMIWAELWSSLRNLSRSPGFSAVVVLTLALGMGANTAVFSVLDAVLIKPLPYPKAHELVTVQETWEGNPQPFPFSRAPVVVAMREWAGLFSGVATIYTYRETGVDLIRDDGSKRLISSYVSAGFFEMLGAAPVLGRTFSEAESMGPGERGDATERPRVAVLSYKAWTRHFGSSDSILGTSVELNGNLTEIIGVMRPGFRNPLGSEADLWVPQDLRTGGSNNWQNYYLNTIARLKPGVSIDQAAKIAETLVEGIREEQPESGEWGITLTALQSDVVGQVRRTMLLILAAAAGLVLLSASVNVGNLVFARGIHREREIALRGALGGARPRLLAHLVLENGWLALGGSVLGLVLGLGGVQVLLAMAPDALPRTTEQPGLSAVVFGAALLALVASLLVFGLAPATILARTPLAKVLNGGGRGGTDSRRLRRLRSLFVIAQVTAAVVLTIGAGLLLRSFSQIREVALGVATDQALTFEVHLPTARYDAAEQRVAFHDQFQERVEGLPGVQAVGAVSWLPLNGRYHTWGSMQEVGSGENPELGVSTDSTDVRVMTGHYFVAAGIQLLQGRPPSQRDRDGEVQAWISRKAADQAFLEKDPMGREVRMAGKDFRVMGVVADVAIDARGTTVPTIYIPHRLFAEDRNWPLVQVVRAHSDSDLLRGPLAAELQAVDPALVLFRPRLFDAYVDQAQAQDRFVLLLMSVFAALALGLVTVGTYGVLAGDVAGRTREIGIRMALGADRTAVRWNVVRGALALVTTGIGIGGVVALAGSRWLSSMLFSVPATDATTYVGAVVVLLLMGVAASFVPVLRATRVDPARTLSDS